MLAISNYVSHPFKRHATKEIMERKLDYLPTYIYIYKIV